MPRYDENGNVIPDTPSVVAGRRVRVVNGQIVETVDPSPVSRPPIAAGQAQVGVSPSMLERMGRSVASVFPQAPTGDTSTMDPAMGGLDATRDPASLAGQILNPVPGLQQAARGVQAAVSIPKPTISKSGLRFDPDTPKQALNAFSDIVEGMGRSSILSLPALVAVAPVVTLATLGLAGGAGEAAAWTARKAGLSPAAQRAASNAAMLVVATAGAAEGLIRGQGTKAHKIGVEIGKTWAESQSKIEPRAIEAPTLDVTPTSGGRGQAPAPPPEPPPMPPAQTPEVYAPPVVAHGYRSPLNEAIAAGDARILQATAVPLGQGAPAAPAVEDPVAVDGTATIARIRAGDVRSKNKGVASVEPNRGPLESRRVSVSSFTPEQIQFLRESTDPGRVASYVGQNISEPIFAIEKQGGKLVLSDGGHRLLAAIDRGDSEIDALVKPAPPEPTSVVPVEAPPVRPVAVVATPQPVTELPLVGDRVFYRVPTSAAGGSASRNDLVLSVNPDGTIVVGSKGFSPVTLGDGEYATFDNPNLRVSPSRGLHRLPRSRRTVAAPPPVPAPPVPSAAPLPPAAPVSAPEAAPALPTSEVPVVEPEPNVPAEIAPQAPDVPPSQPASAPAQPAAVAPPVVESAPAPRKQLPELRMRVVRGRHDPVTVVFADTADKVAFETLARKDGISKNPERYKDLLAKFPDHSTPEVMKAAFDFKAYVLAQTKAMPTSSEEPLLLEPEKTLRDFLPSKAQPVVESAPPEPVAPPTLAQKGKAEFDQKKALPSRSLTDDELLDLAAVSLGRRPHSILGRVGHGTSVTFQMKTPHPMERPDTETYALTDIGVPHDHVMKYELKPEPSKAEQSKTVFNAKKAKKMKRLGIKETSDVGGRQLEGGQIGGAGTVSGLPHQPTKGARRSPQESQSSRDRRDLETLSRENARMGGWKGTDDEFKIKFDEELHQLREFWEDRNQIAHENNIFEAIADAGGIGNDEGYPGEIEWWRGASSGMVDPKGTNKYGNRKKSVWSGRGKVADVAGVLDDKGHSLDTIREAIAQEPQWRDKLVGINDLLDIMREQHAVWMKMGGTESEFYRDPMIVSRFENAEWLKEDDVSFDVPRESESDVVPEIEMEPLEPGRVVKTELGDEPMLPGRMEDLATILREAEPALMADKTGVQKLIDQQHKRLLEMVHIAKFAKDPSDRLVAQDKLADMRKGLAELKQMLNPEPEKKEEVKQVFVFGDEGEGYSRATGDYKLELDASDLHNWDSPEVQARFKDVFTPEERDAIQESFKRHHQKGSSASEEIKILRRKFKGEDKQARAGSWRPIGRSLADLANLNAGATA